MRIMFYSAGGDNTAAWLSDLQAAFPQAEVRVWSAGDTQAADYAVVWKPPIEMLQHRTDLKAIFNIGAGVDAILKFGDALPAGVPIVRLDDAGMAIQMAEYVTHAALRYFRRMDEYDLQTRDRHWRPLTARDKSEFSIGVLGLGVLGNRVAQALAHFDFPLLGWSRTPKEVPGMQCYSGAQGLDSFLRGSRVLVCMLPLTTETTGILNRETLGKLPRGSYLINVARGGHVVEPDLLALIEQQHIAAATLDVFHDEPLPAAHPFWQERRITITPHISALTLRTESALQIAKKIGALESGAPIAGVVDTTKGY